MLAAIDAEIKQAAAGIFTDEELADLFSDGVPETRPTSISEDDHRSFAERLQASREAKDRACFRADFMMQTEVCEPDPKILAALNSIGTDHDKPLQDLLALRMATLIERDLAISRAAYTERTREESGRVWDLLPPGTTPRAGDEIEDEGVWRPRPVIANYRSRYERAVFSRCEAENLYDAAPSEETRAHLEQAWLHQCKALRTADDETVQERDRIDEWRAGEGREIFNASRRKVRDTPNTDLSIMTDSEKAAHTREQARLRKQRSRARATVRP